MTTLRLGEIDKHDVRKKNEEVSNDVWKYNQRYAEREKVQRTMQNIEIINIVLFTDVYYIRIAREQGDTDREKKREKQKKKQTTAEVLWQMKSLPQ